MSKASAFIRKIMPTVLTVLGSGATIAAVIFAAKEGPRYEKILEESPEMKTKDKVITAVKVFAPAIGCATVSVACGVGAHCMDLHTQASLTGAYVAVEQAYKKYRQKNNEINGEDADISVREAVESEKLPDFMRDEHGERLYEVHLESLDEEGGKEIFTATKADLLGAMIRINWMLDHVGSVTLNDVRGMFKLEPIDGGAEVGWSADMLCDWYKTYQLEFTIEELNQDMLLMFPRCYAYGGYLSDYGMDY